MLAGVLFYYAASSQVVWLLLIAYWVAALVVAAFFYTLWNRGVNLHVKRVAIVRNKGLAHVEPPEAVTRDETFEGDSIRTEFALVTRGGTRGPARISGKVGVFALSMAAGVVRKDGWRERKVQGPLRRGPVTMTEWKMVLGDPLGLFGTQTTGPNQELELVLPRFATLRMRSQARELEATVTAQRAGSGTEIFGVREYRPGDALRRIHWRSSARRGELIVREFEPPGVQSLGIFCDPKPASPEAADQVARLAASEAWDCLRAGGRVTLWAPGCEPSRPDEERNMVALLEWLARYPLPAERGGDQAGGDVAASTPPPPPMSDAVAITTTSDPRLLDALEMVRVRGGSARAWVVGEAQLALDVPVERAGFGWPL